MSQVTDAWDDLYAAQTEFIGTAQVVQIGATASIPAIVEEVPRDSVYIDGGIGEAQTFNIQIKASSLSNVEPAKKTTAVTFTPVGSNTAYSGKVISVRSNNGIFYITAGDPNTNL